MIGAVPVYRRAAEPGFNFHHLWDAARSPKELPGKSRKNEAGSVFQRTVPEYPERAGQNFRNPQARMAISALGD